MTNHGGITAQHPFFSSPNDYATFLHERNGRTQPKIAKELATGRAHGKVDRLLPGAGAVVARWEQQHVHDRRGCADMADSAFNLAGATFYLDSTRLTPEGPATLEQLFDNNVLLKLTNLCRDDLKQAEPVDPARVWGPATWMHFDPAEVGVIRMRALDRWERLLNALEATDPPAWKIQAMLLLGLQEWTMGEVAEHFNVPYWAVRDLRQWLREKWAELEEDDGAAA